MVLHTDSKTDNSENVFRPPKVFEVIDMKFFKKQVSWARSALAAPLVLQRHMGVITRNQLAPMLVLLLIS